MPTSVADIRERLTGCDLFIVPYCHADWAWTHTRRWHAMRYAQVIDEVLDIMANQDRDGVPVADPAAFRWYMDCYRTELAPFLESHPERVEELRQRVAEGRVAACGGFANVRINHVDGELFVRSMVLGRRVFRDLFPAVDLSAHSDIVDVAVGHPQLPQLLRLAGFKHLQFWRPHTAMDAKGIPHQFVWRGIDGTDVIAARGSYTGLINADLTPGAGDEAWEQTVERWWTRELRERSERSPVGVLWLQHGADDSRPLRSHFNSDEPMDLPSLVTEWNRRETSHMRFATPVEAFRTLEQLRDRLPVVAGTLDPCDVCYNAAWAGSSGLWRVRSDGAQDMGVAETLNALALGVGASASQASCPEARWTELWQDLLLCSAHATQWLFQDDFDEISALGSNVLYEIRHLQRHAAQSLSRCIDLPAATEAVVVNPLPFARSATVPLRLTFVEGDRRGVPKLLRLVDANGAELPHQVLGEMHHAGVRWEVDVLVQIDLPSCGWSVVCREESPPAEAPDDGSATNVLENDSLRLEFTRGRLVMIVDKEEGDREWSAPVDTPFGHIRAYQVDPDAPLHVGAILARTDVCWDEWRVVERGPVRWTMRAVGRVGPHGVCLETRLLRGEKRVEFGVEIDWAGMDGFVASHVPYPVPGELTGDMPFCVEVKDLQKEPYVGIERQREGMFIAQSFVDWHDGSGGLAYVSHDGERYYIFDRQAPSLAHILVNSVRRRTGSWEQHVNREMEGEGVHRFTFSLLPHDGDWRSAQLWRAARALRVKPVVVRPQSAAGGSLPGCHSLLEVLPASLTLSACYVEGGRLMIRVFENAGKAADAVLTLPFEPSAAGVVDLLGNPREEPALSVNGQTLSFQLTPWQIVTIAMPLP